MQVDWRLLKQLSENMDEMLATFSMDLGFIKQQGKTPTHYPLYSSRSAPALITQRLESGALLYFLCELLERMYKQLHLQCENELIFAMEPASTLSVSSVPVWVAGLDTNLVLLERLHHYLSNHSGYRSWSAIVQRIPDLHIRHTVRLLSVLSVYSSADNETLQLLSRSFWEAPYGSQGDASSPCPVLTLLHTLLEGTQDAFKQGEREALLAAIWEVLILDFLPSGAMAGLSALSVSVPTVALPPAVQEQLMLCARSSRYRFDLLFSATEASNTEASTPPFSVLGYQESMLNFLKIVAEAVDQHMMDFHQKHTAAYAGGGPFSPSR